MIWNESLGHLGLSMMCHIINNSFGHRLNTQNGLAESLIKRLQLIGRPLLLRTKFLLSA